MNPQIAQPAGAATDTKTILVVEDDDDIRQLLCAVVGRDAHRVLAAADGEGRFRLATSPSACHWSRRCAPVEGTALRSETATTRRRSCYGPGRPRPTSRR